MAGTLYIVGTPIGNLGDLSPRAEQVLGSVDAVLAEDTRVTSRLLAHCGLQVSLERCDENVIVQRAPQLVERLAAGEDLAFCSDAGMPCISDPGTVLVDAVRRSDHDIDGVVVPGPTAVTTALAASGLTTDAFYFGGFLPRRSSERTRLLQTLAPLPATLVFYESPYRVVSALRDVAQVMPRRRVCVARELTKLHEEELLGTADRLADALEAREGRVKGEIVLLVEAGVKGGVDAEGPGDLSLEELETRVAALLAEDAGSRSTVARTIAREFGVPKAVVYDAMCGNGTEEDGPQRIARAIMGTLR